MSLDSLQKQIDEIKARNARVELDKAWETSWTRRILVIVLTYLVVLIFFVVAQLPDPYVSALVPSGAFLLSTMTLPVVKRWWTK
ncbi:hypothetical protein IPJ72_07420 [Candidatus Peregrinibacteria bacterium]|nr:MAG: hypothetical protein IPJ72_07420 [Candidatus Peregrinibacteria bacterium]